MWCSCFSEYEFLTHHNLQGSQTQHGPWETFSAFLTHHNLQGSQTYRLVIMLYTVFLTHRNLQGSQTHSIHGFYPWLFLTHHNLQGSQTCVGVFLFLNGFLPIIIYKVLKRVRFWHDKLTSFLPIIIYKVLKLIDSSPSVSISFLPIIIYKVLKPQICILVITEPTCLTTAKLWLHLILQLNSGRCQ